MAEITDKEICEALHALRRGQTKNLRARESTKEFLKMTGVHEATANDVEANRYKPKIPIIERWVVGCGATLWEFFRGIEHRKARNKARIAVGHEAYYELLTNIIEARGLPLCEGTLVAAGRALNVEMPDGLPPMYLDPHRTETLEAIAIRRKKPPPKAGKR